MSQIEAALYETAPGKKVRVVLDHSGGLRPVFWFKVSTDGSIYLGLRLKTVTSMRAGAKHTEHGVLTVLYEEGEEIKDPSLLKGKISFHHPVRSIVLGSCSVIRFGVLASKKNSVEYSLLILPHSTRLRVILEN